MRLEVRFVSTACCHDSVVSLPRLVVITSVQAACLIEKAFVPFDLVSRVRDFLISEVAFHCDFLLSSLLDCCYHHFLASLSHSQSTTQLFVDALCVLFVCEVTCFLSSLRKIWSVFVSSRRLSTVESQLRSQEQDHTA